jgi:uracil-DNA glycosylase
VSLLPHPVTGQPFPSPVPPGTGWPDDPATDSTPVARSADEVRSLAASASLAEVDARVSVCSACPRLVTWREDVARSKRASYAGEPYWGRPIGGWGPAEPRVLIIGLAPAANGGNRTGRIFTGDRSGDFLFASLFRCGLASQPDSVTAGDGLRLTGARMAAAVRCAPPENKPTPAERDRCLPYATEELELLSGTRVVVCLGGFAWQVACGLLGVKPRPKFGHGAEHETPSGLALLGCYHPSQQNTFTGTLTEPMMDSVLLRAKDLAGL